MGESGAGDVVDGLSGLTPGAGLGALRRERADIVALTQASYEAVMFPKDPGALSHGLRAALACRIARMNDATELISHYAALAAAAGDDAQVAAIAAGKDVADAPPALKAIVAHSDKVTLTPLACGRNDIDGLRAVGLDEAGIIALSELISFLSYQIRVVAGLKILGAAQ
ncbi:CMD domain-containing protein [Leptospira interrogans]